VNKRGGDFARKSSSNPHYMHNATSHAKNIIRDSFSKRTKTTSSNIHDHDKFQMVQAVRSDLGEVKLQ
jgi:hypothetical protein